MSLLGDAFERAGARVQGIVDVTERAIAAGEGEAQTSDAALTTAGTDVPGVELARRIEHFMAAVREGASFNGEELSDSVKAALNGAALVWFWVGYEARRLQEGGES